MKLDLNEALTYDDVVIVPQFSEHTTRAQSNTSWKLKNFTFQKPIIAANMDTICGPEMALQMAQLGGLGIIHRYLTVAQYKEISDSWHANNPEFPLAFAVGTLSNDKERIDFCMNGGCEIICIDIAHGDCQAMLDTIAYIRASWDGALIAGNTATFEGTKRLIDAGADIVKVGVGSGGLCSTRVKTGCGMGQLSAVIECAEAGPVIADGGIKEPAHACKALAGGATSIMIGGMLGGTDKAPGWINPLDCPNAETKVAGMASLSSKTKAGLRGINAEGVERTVSCKPAGSTAHVIEDITEGIRSAMSYTGAFTLEEFTEKAVLRKISIAGQAEGPPHFKDK